MNERIRKLAEKLPEYMDAALVTSNVGRYYYTGFLSSTGILLITRDNARLLVDFRYIEAAKRKVVDTEVMLLKNESDQISRLLSDEKAVNVGFENKYATVEDYLYWKKQLPGIIMEPDNPLSGLISKQRRIKDAQEALKMQAAQEIADRCYTEILNFVNPGVSEKEIANRLAYLMREMGADKESFDTIVLSGSNTSMPHGVPTDRAVKTGDFVLMDFGVIKDGYCSDMTRTVAVGSITDEMYLVYQTVLSAQRTALQAIKVGKLCKEVDNAARELIDKSGYFGCFGHSTGHSLGLEVHETPSFSMYSNDIIESGLVMSVEPGIYLDDKFGCRIEDVVFIQDNIIRNITGSSKELIVL